MGGAEVALSRLLGAIDRRKWQPVALLGQAGPLADTLHAANVPVDILKLPNVLGNVRQGNIRKTTSLSPRRVISATFYVVHLAIRLRQRRVDLIHANSLKACVL